MGRLSIYIGSTHDENKREQEHKSNWNNENYKGYNLKVYIFIRDNGGYDNWIFEVIEEFPCENKIELVIRERYHFDLFKVFSPDMEDDFCFAKNVSIYGVIPISLRFRLSARADDLESRA